ncbi:MAG: hypothetical protein ACR2PU_03740 [Gammaproteobacteria bacterium]
METNNFISSVKAKFLRYQLGVAYYAVPVPYSELLYSFPVPLDDIENDILNAEDKTIFFMEYIRKAIQEGTLNKVTHKS